jgi:hypothetical protein
MLGDLALLGEGFVGGLFGGDDFVELGHGDLGEIAAGDLPFVVGFDYHGGGQAQERRRVGKDLHDVGAAFDLFVEAFDRVVRPDLLPVCPRERGNAVNASTSALAWFIMVATFGKLPARESATVSHWAATSSGSV